MNRTTLAILALTLCTPAMAQKPDRNAPRQTETMVVLGPHGERERIEISRTLSDNERAVIIREVWRWHPEWR